MSRFDRTPAKTKRAQSLRNDMPDAERKLWARLKGKQLGALRFRRQHPMGPYFMDFYCAEIKLCIELDGDQHGHEIAMHKDQRRTQFLQEKGVYVMRFWNEDVFENIDGVVETIYEQAMNLKREIEIGSNETPSP